MEILSVFYSEFEIMKGAELLFQYPTGALSNDSFKNISFFMSPNNNLCGKLNTLIFEGDKII